MKKFFLMVSGIILVSIAFAAEFENINKDGELHKTEWLELVDFLTEIKPIATSGSYNDLLNKPALKPIATSGNYNDLLNKPALKTVATSGNYNDLSNKPAVDGVPSGAIMAFDKGSCPSGWTRYSKADNRFLMGSSSPYRTTGGSNTATLSLTHIPRHSHFVQDTASSEHTSKTLSYNGNQFYIDYQESRNSWPGSSGGWDGDNSLFFVYRKTSNKLCSGSGFHHGVFKNGYTDESKCQYNNTSFSIRNPYVGVLYCKKN